MAQKTLIFCAVILTYFRAFPCQEDRTCPLYGCTFAGTFSYRADVPEANVTIKWISPLVSNFMPDALGCVGNEVNLVCPSLSPSFSSQSHTDRPAELAALLYAADAKGSNPYYWFHKHNCGYVSINSQTGQAIWRDDVLRDPTLPIMDRNGEIIGSDGYELVRYTADGQTVQPEVHLNPPLYPIYSLTISSTGLVLIVSKSGQVATYDSGGMQISSMWLNGTVERFGGTFIPMAQPVLYRSRAYILTQFRPFNIKPPDLGMQRLYAIDILTDIVPRLEVAWVYNFEREMSYQPQSSLMKILSKKSLVENFEAPKEQSFDQNLENPQWFGNTERNPKDPLSFSVASPSHYNADPVRLIEANPLVMYNADLSTVYVNLPPPDPILPRFSNLWALKDQQDNPERMFMISANISKMAMYESMGSGSMNNRLFDRGFQPTSDARRNEKAGIYFIWAIGADSETVMKISPFEGTILDSVNISALVKAPAVVTSDLMVTRAYDEGDDVLLMGISVPLQTQTKDFSLLCTKCNVQENTTGLLIALKGDNLLWMVATPDNTDVRGQIIPIPVDSENNRFIAFSGNKEKSYIFSFN